MSDRLVLKNMVFYGYHGAYAAEKEMGQKFEVDLGCTPICAMVAMIRN